MADQNALLEQNSTPEDVATLYSWANLHGAKYRDFSANRAAMREKARQRMEADLAREREQAQLQAEAEKQAEAVEAARGEEKVLQEKALREEAAAEHASRQAAQHAAEMEQLRQEVHIKAQEEARAVALKARAEAQARIQAESRAAAQTASEAQLALQQTAWPLPPREQAQWLGDARENAHLPAWFTAEQAAVSAEASLQEARERMTSRWFALRGVFHQDAAAALPEPAPAVVAQRAPVLAVFSLAGGVGKTAVAATLGRALSARGERVLLVDTASFGLLPFYYGSADQRPGQLRTFLPPGSAADAPIQMVTLDPEESGDGLAAEIGQLARGTSRVIIDLATASGATTRKVLRMAPVVLVPLAPDMNSVVSIHAIDSFFRNHESAASASVMPYYVLNQFDASLPLHLDVREELREQLGDRLLPFTLRRTPAISEALAEGMTVIDYAPGSAIADDFTSLAGWFKSHTTSAGSGLRGARWSER